MFKGLFSKDECNVGRQHEADMARFICIVGMVFVHVFEYGLAAVDPSAAVSSGELLDIIGGASGATLFMAIMGLGVAYSSASAPNKTLRRGLLLLLGGYALNFARATIWIIAEFVPSMLHMPNLLITLFTGDIFQFAGLVLIFFALVKKLKLPDWAIFSIAVACLLVSYIVPETLTQGNMLLGVLVGLFFRQNEYCTFCFFEWLIYPVLGYLFGKLLRHCVNKTAFYGRLLVLSSLGIALYVGISVLLSFDIYSMYSSDAVYFLQMPEKVILNIMGLAFMISLRYFIEVGLHHILPKTRDFIRMVSADLPEIYVVHWLIVGNGAYFATVEMLQWKYLIALVVLVISLVLAHLCHRTLKKHKANKIKASAAIG